MYSHIREVLAGIMVGIKYVLKLIDVILLPRNLKKAIMNILSVSEDTGQPGLESGQPYFWHWLPSGQQSSECICPPVPPSDS